MKVAIVVLFAVFATASAIRKHATKFVDHNKVAVTHDEDADYNNYVEQHHPNYKKDKYHHQRVAKFKKTRQEIIEHDPDQAGFAKGFTQFAHMTDEEIDQQWNKHINDGDPKFFQLFERAPEYDARAVTVAASLDLRTQNLVTSVKDQGQCGSCYTFAAAASLEGVYAKKTGKLIDISTQQYVDCSQGYGFSYYYDPKARSWIPGIAPNVGGNSGCNGGMYEACWGYNNFTAAQNSWSCYSYVSGKTVQAGKCAPAACNNTVKPTGFVSVTNETNLMIALNVAGPVACSINASPIMSYTGGVADCSNSRANHAITVVGYGTDAKTGVDYWLIKNSWNTWWGENGYLRLRRGVNACGIGANRCAYPVL